MRILWHLALVLWALCLTVSQPNSVSRAAAILAKTLICPRRLVCHKGWGRQTIESQVVQTLKEQAKSVNKYDNRLQAISHIKDKAMNLVETHSWSQASDRSREDLRIQLSSMLKDKPELVHRLLSKNESDAEKWMKECISRNNESSQKDPIADWMKKQAQIIGDVAAKLYFQASGHHHSHPEALNDMERGSIEILLECNVQAHLDKMFQTPEGKTILSKILKRLDRNTQ